MVRATAAKGPHPPQPARLWRAGGAGARSEGPFGWTFLWDFPQVGFLAMVSEARLMPTADHPAVAEDTDEGF